MKLQGSPYACLIMFIFYGNISVFASYCMHEKAERFCVSRANNLLRSPFDVIATSTGFSFMFMIFTAYDVFCMSKLRTVSNFPGFPVYSGNFLLWFEEFIIHVMSENKFQFGLAGISESKRYVLSCAYTTWHLYLEWGLLPSHTVICRTTIQINRATSSMILVLL